MIAIGCDHAAYAFKNLIIKHLNEKGYEIKDFGTYDADKKVDYPDFAFAVADSVANGECDKGILICGTGIGMSIAANKVKGIRCAHCSDTFSARASREHNDANILALGERVLGPALALDIVDIFLNTPFSNDERHIRRLRKISEHEEIK